MRISGGFGTLIVLVKNTRRVNLLPMRPDERDGPTLMTEWGNRQVMALLSELKESQSRKWTTARQW